MAEAVALKAIQCGFESHQGHMDKEDIKWENLTLPQQKAAAEILEAYHKAFEGWGRQSGRTTVTQFVHRELMSNWDYNRKTQYH